LVTPTKRTLRGSMTPRLSRAEAAVRERWTRWFRYFRGHLYQAEGRSDADLARALGVSKGIVSRILTGERAVGVDIAIKMLATFRKQDPTLTLDRLTFEDPPKSTPPEGGGLGSRKR